MSQRATVAASKRLLSFLLVQHVIKGRLELTIGQGPDNRSVDFYRLPIRFLHPHEESRRTLYARSLAILHIAAYLRRLSSALETLLKRGRIQPDRLSVVRQLRDSELILVLE